MSEIEKWFTTSATVERLSGSVDSGGAQTMARSTIATISGHLYSVSANEINLLQRYEGRTLKKFLCPSASDVIFSDILTINGAEYDVIEVLSRLTGANSHLDLKLLLRE